LESDETIGVLGASMQTFSNLDKTKKEESKTGSIRSRKQSEREIITLSKQSKFMIIIRVLILFLLFIYVPIESIFLKNIEKVENVQVFSWINDKFYKDGIFINKAGQITFKILISFFGDKDMISLYISLVYFLYHPFVALKIVFVTHSVHYLLVLIRILYGAYRPFWQESNSVVYWCQLSYSNPSLHYFFASFFFLYIYIAINNIKGRGKFTRKKKIIMMILVFIFTFGYALLLLFSKLNFIYQLNFAFTTGLVILCIVLDLEVTIHNYILSSLKNLLRIRKNKFKILIIIIIMGLFANLFNMIGDDDEFTDVLSNLQKTGACLQSNEIPIYLIGRKSTLVETSYIFGIIGAYWGTAFTVENNCGKFWEGTTKNKILKVAIILIFGGGVIVGSSKYYF
jgi:hypothetical protein